MRWSSTEPGLMTFPRSNCRLLWAAPSLLSASPSHASVYCSGDTVTSWLHRAPGDSPQILLSGSSVSTHPDFICFCLAPQSRSLPCLSQPSSLRPHPKHLILSPPFSLPGNNTQNLKYSSGQDPCLHAPETDLGRSYQEKGFVARLLDNSENPSEGHGTVFRQWPGTRKAKP